MGRKFVLFLLFFLPLQFIQCLELTRVIVSSNNDPMYIQFWPIVAPLWQKMGLCPTLLLVADEDCTVDTSIGEVIRFEPLPDVPQSLQAQAIRLLAPALFPEDGCLISDIDMLPVSFSYFFNGAYGVPSDAFLVYRQECFGRWPMCYVAAKGEVFSSIFEVTCIEDFPARLREWYALGHGWNTDEVVMYSLVRKWEREQGGLVHRLHHSVGARLDRAQWDSQIKSLEIDKYIDCHSVRPYSEHKNSIDQVVEAIIVQWEKEGL